MINFFKGLRFEEKQNFENIEPVSNNFTVLMLFLF